MHITAAQVRWFRFHNSGLHEPFATPEAIAEALFGVQAQILPAAALALWQRTPDLTYAEVNHRLHESRSLIKLWGQRGTLHLYRTEDWPLLHSALSQRRTWWQAQAEKQQGAEEYKQKVLRAAALLKEHNFLTRSRLYALDAMLNKEDFSSWGGVFSDLVHQGVACHAGQEGNEGRFAHREHWLPDLPWTLQPSDTANTTVMQRYFRAYAPAAESDFRYWRNAKTGESHRWLAQLTETLVEITVDEQLLLVHREDLDALCAPPPPPEAWPVRLLYRFDPLLLGHKDKTWLLEPEHYRRVWRPAGHIEGTLLLHGRIAGTWRYDRQNGGLKVTLTPFAPLPDYARPTIEAQAQGIAEFFALPLAALDIIA